MRPQHFVDAKINTHHARLQRTQLAGGVVRIWVNSDVHKGFFVRQSVNTK
jgi:hypothetical protein